MMTDNGLMFFSKDGSDIKPCKKEAFRYMGYKAEGGNEEIEKLYEKCNAEYKKAASYKAVMCKVPIAFKGDNIIDFGFCEIENENLYKNLSGCDGAYVFAATSGVAVDRLIMRYSSISPAEAMICDSIASSAVEVWCDEVNDEINKLYETKPRFSPGYGGVSLQNQKDVLSFLDAERKLGITLSDSLMMVPAKSVTAFVGVCKK
jgi:hypothetical protein